MRDITHSLTGDRLRPCSRRPLHSNLVECVVCTLSPYAHTRSTTHMATCTLGNHASQQLNILPLFVSLSSAYSIASVCLSIRTAEARNGLLGGRVDILLVTCVVMRDACVGARTSFHQCRVLISWGPNDDDDVDDVNNNTSRGASPRSV